MSEEKTALAPQHPSNALFKHEPHPHRIQNANVIFEAEKAAANFNQRVAVRMTKLFSAMPTFWLIAAWIILWILANATIAHFDPLPWPLLLCLASVPQLPLMIVIMVGQGLLGRKQEIQAEEQYKTTMNTYHDIEQIMAHMSAQDEEILRQTRLIVELCRASGMSSEHLSTLVPQKETVTTNAIPSNKA
ncbi:hypothetical protein KDW_43120 [Dictyobacter vulcani]|uniref:DUF1003 domain-containing protein n=1 Tax=Dictyobacter vulcani TaxID=2607529 RepID=A0A5J4KUJ7_9CHLR|nr:DUF1003 domain-containing protein [Dictyobacter vulcani]GER90150.1 hypothetical protein KDW_43120 [Dictyobacter vulcani]